MYLVYRVLNTGCLFNVELRKFTTFDFLEAQCVVNIVGLYFLRLYTLNELYLIALF
jgi:hypothetical protein